MAELGEFELKAESKLAVDVEMLEYEYIEKCTDPEKLRAIVEVLKSGKEGFYPDLEDKAEKKWLSVLSEKDRNRILRLRQQVTPTEIQQAGDDLYQWQNEIEQLDAELKAKENKKSSQQRGNVPPVRGTKREKLDASSQSSQQRSQSGGGAANQSDSRATQAQRLSGYDFQAWEKFDVDAAVNAIDDEEKVAEREKQVSRETGKKLAEELRLKRLQRYEDELSKIRSEMNTSNMTALQRKSLAVREKQKGNEAFKANELNEAFVFYSRSLALDDSIAAVHANRALVSIRLEKLETGEDDATRALALDPNHMKALSRRGLARFKLGKTALAIEDFQRALDLKPGNAELEQLLEKAKAKFLEVEGHEYGSSPVKLPPSSSSSSSDSSVVLTVKVVSSAKDLLLPSHSESTGGGKLIRVDRSPSQKFTRIAIQESDEEGEEEQDQGDELTPSTTAAAAGSTASAGGGFTRIAIQLDSESDEEGDAEADAEPTEEPKPETKSSFTRIPISVVESDSEEEQAPSEAELEAQALSFKEQGNEFMKAEDYARALRSYSESLNLSPNGPHAIAALSNRSLAYLQLKNYTEAITDTSAVLSQAPDNLKVLYRRALAYEAMANFSKSLEDIQKILQLDPTNQLALKTRERLQKVLLPASSSSPRSPSAPLASKPQHQGSPSQAQSAAPPEETSEDWKLETAKKEALKFLQNGSVEKAVAVLEGALSGAEVAADSDQLLSLRQLLAGAYTSLEDYQKVLKVSEAILRDHPNNFKALSRAGDAAYHLGQTARAKEYATRVLRVDPINADARVLLDALEEQSKPPSPPPPSPSPASASGSRSPLSPAHPSVSMSSLTLSPETEALSLQKKNEGNEAMKSGDFSLAIDRYSEAIALDSSNMMFFNNRAQAHLKIAHFPAAESDSTVVINSNPRLPNLKALFRRALARKGIGTKQSLQEGLQDLNAILNAEPANKEAKLERGKLQVMLAGLVQREEEAEEKRRLEEERERMKLLPSSERIVDESGIVARKTVLLKKNQSSQRGESEQHELTEVATSPKKKGRGEGSPVQTLPASAGSGSAVKSSPSTPQSTSRSPATPSPASHSKDPTKRMISVATPTLPTEPPKTVYELERVWRGMKNHPALFGQYLRLFKRTTFKKVIKETVSPDLISSILLVVKEHLLVTDSAAALVVLEGLTKTPKFEILLSILPEEDLCCIRDCVEHLATHADRERGDKLKEAYHL